MLFLAADWTEPRINLLCANCMMYGRSSSAVSLFLCLGNTVVCRSQVAGRRSQVSGTHKGIFRPANTLASFCEHSTLHSPSRHIHILLILSPTTDLCAFTATCHPPSAPHLSAVSRSEDFLVIESLAQASSGNRKMRRGSSARCCRTTDASSMHS